MTEAPLPSRRNPSPPAWVLWLFPAVLVGAPLYAWLVAHHPVLGQSGLAVVALSMLFATTLIFLVAGLDRDRLDPLRIVSGVFLLVYCVAPLFAREIEWNFERPVGSLLAGSSFYVLAAFLGIALGYHLPVGRLRRPDMPEPLPSGALAPARFYGLALFALGLLSYAILVIRSGGPGQLIAGSETRVEFAKGMGYLLHGAFLLLSGGALYFAARASGRGPLRWAGAIPLLLAAAGFLVLQNRSRVLWALVTVLLIAHYRLAPVRLWRLSLYGSVVFVGFVLFGFARQPSIRPLLLVNPLGVVRALFQDFHMALETFFGVTLNRLQQVMLAFDNFPDRVPHEWGSTLLALFNPIVRLVGLEHAQIPSLGHRFYELARPDLPPWIETGFHPSLVGEMLVNFPWYLALLTFPLFGLLLRLLYVRLVLERRDALSLALYAVVLFRVVDMVVVGVGQLLFGIAVVSIPLLLARPLLPRRTLRATPAAHAPAAT